MPSQLDEQRLKDNLLEQIRELQRKVRRLEETAVRANGDGTIAAEGLRLTVLDEEPKAPPAGEVVVYVQLIDGTAQARAKDASGTVRILANFAATGVDVRVRHVGTGEYWRLYMDVGAAGKDQFFYEPEDE